MSGHLAPKAILATLAALGLAFALAMSASAHAELVRSEPAANAVLATPPSELRLWFSEAPEPNFTQVLLLDSSGNTVQGSGDMAVDPTDATAVRVPLRNLPNGTYTVAWRTTSDEDGHVESGSYSFSVGTGQQVVAPVPAGSVGSAPGLTPMEVGVKWLGYLGMALLAGALAFLVLVLRPAVKNTPHQTHSSLDQPVLNLVVVGWGLTVLLTVVGVILQAANAAGVPVSEALGRPLGTVMRDTRYGAVLWPRLMLLAGIPIVFFSQRLMQEREEEGLPAVPISMGLSLMVLLTTSLMSHAASSGAMAGHSGPYSSAMPQVLADWIHLLSASFWIGGLVALVVTMLSINKNNVKGTASLAAEVLGRFSYLAACCVVALGVTGVLRASVELPNWQDLLDTPYGNALLAKLALIIPLLGLAWVNRYFVQRRVRAFRDGVTDTDGHAPWYRLLSKTVGGEVLLTSLVLLATSVLTVLPPPR